MSANLLEINVASPAGIVLLKLIAWEDRKLSTTKDAEDLHFLLRHYIDLGNKASLETNHVDLYEDIETAHARLLGRDLLSICTPKTLSVVKGILDREMENLDESQLIKDLLPKYAEVDQQELCWRLLMAMQSEMFTENSQ